MDIQTNQLLSCDPSVILETLQWSPEELAAALLETPAKMDLFRAIEPHLKAQGGPARVESAVAHALFLGVTTDTLTNERAVIFHVIAAKALRYLGKVAEADVEIALAVRYQTNVLLDDGEGWWQFLNAVIQSERAILEAACRSVFTQNHR